MMLLSQSALLCKEARMRGDENAMAAPPKRVRRRVCGTRNIDPDFTTNLESSETTPPAIGSRIGWPVLSLFSGAGGLDLGFQTAGFLPMLAIDINPAAVETYQINNPGTTTVAMDLSTTPPLDIVDLWEQHCGDITPTGIIGGPPCQGYSPSNVHQTDDDPRRRLLFNYADTVATFKDRFEIDFFVLENVPGLLHKRHCALFDEFENQCDDVSFDVVAATLDAGTFGIAQHRERLVVVGINRDRYPLAGLRLSEGDKDPPTVADVLEGLPEPAFCARDLDLSAIPYHQNHVTMVPRSKKFADGSLKRGNSKGLSFKVLAWDAPSYTVAYGHNEVHVHPECHRRLSIYEAMLLQGFPQHGYHLHGTFTEQVQLVSNAVPPPLGEGIANAIAKSLGYRKTYP
ncbi:MAG: DNA cytosine methyltransferase [Chloroflexi bacterium]|nr:DNA cytosine methyltransferase [Chloroflexota bacterium]MYD49479.1 DNA cytosine methyltransferase [Chloroflexota bacterium]